jgi:outer membrane protein OmpA-like peptidoglycan-associated protein
MDIKKNWFVFGCLLLTLTLNSAIPAQGLKSTDPKEANPTKTTLAVRYVENKKTVVNLSGTSLAPRVTGRAEVEYKKNDARIKIKVQNFDHPQTLGAYYTTYVIWAITPEGQADNLIELPAGYTAELQARSSAQTFGIIITAEPHSSVKVPSQKIIAETTLAKNAVAGVQTTQAEFRLDRGRFYEVSETEAASLKPDYSTPRLVLGARRSLDIARRAGAKEFAASEWQEAQGKLATLEQIWPRNLKDETKFSGLARDVMRLGQVARDLATEREYQARIEDERQARLRSLQEARAQAERAIAEAERTRLEADRARAEAERARAQAEAAKIEAEKSERSAAAERARAADERARREQAAREAEMSRAKEESARIEADKARMQAEQSRLQAEQSRQQAEQAKQQAEDAKRERDAIQQKLFVSLSEILDTKREARGLIVNIGDVLFDTGKATLKPAAREKLSKLTGILLAYPGNLVLEIEGHTDSVGSDDLNNRLSQSRAESVRDYLLSAGLKEEKINAVRGFGKSKPIATNDTAAGRQVNRRVEVIIEDADKKIQ